MFSVIFQTKFYYFWPIVDRFEVTVLIKLTRIQSKVKHCIQHEINALNIAVMIYLSQLNAVFLIVGFVKENYYLEVLLLVSGIKQR